MLIVVAALLVLNLFALGGLWWVLRRQQARTTPLAERACRLAGEETEALAQTGTFLPGKQTVITVEILNPVELATQKHWAAGAVGNLAPGVLRKIVNDQAMAIMRVELEKHGVKAALGQRNGA